MFKSITESYTIFKSVFDSKEVDEDDYEFSEKEIEEIKTYLDGVKKLESLLKQFMLNGKENNIDYVFMGILYQLLIESVRLTAYIIKSATILHQQGNHINQINTGYILIIRRCLRDGI